MSFYPPFAGGITYLPNGIDSLNCNTLGNLYTTGGNVGVGTTTPQFTFDVTTGTINASNYTGGNIQLSGTVSAASFASSLLRASTITSANISISSTVCAGTLNISGNTTLGSIYASATNNTQFSPAHIFINASSSNNPSIIGMYAPNAQSTWGANGINMIFGQSRNIGNAIQQGFEYYGDNNTTNNYQLSWFGGGGGTFSMNRAGRIGINTTNQAYTFDVNGTINASSGFTGASLSVSGAISASSYVGSLVSVGSIGAVGVTVGTLYASTITAASAQVSGTISAATLVGSLVSSGNMASGSLTTGALNITPIDGVTIKSYHTGSSTEIQMLRSNTAANLRVGIAGGTGQVLTNAIANAGILTNDNGVIQIGTGQAGSSSARITITTTGNVGVNTITPGYTLDVIGTINASSGFTGSSLQVSGAISAATLVSSLVSAASIGASGITVGTLYTSSISSSNLQLSGVVSAATLVGSLVSAASIGASGITVGTLYTSSISSSNLQLSGTISAATFIGSLVSAASIGVAGATIGTLYTSNISSSNLQLSGAVSAATLVGSLVSAGSIGVGGITTGYVSLGYPGANQQIALADRGASGFWGFGANNLAIQYQVPSGSSHIFYTGSTTGTSSAAIGTQIATINASGISSSSIQLSGAASVRANGPALDLNSVTDGLETSIRFNFNSVSTGNTWVMGHNVGSVGNGNFALYRAGAGNYITATTAGNVGIKTNTPVYPLDINGTVNASSGFTGSSVAVSGTVSAATHVGTLMSAGSIGAAGATIGTLYASTITASNLYVSGSVISVNITTMNIIDNVISSGTLIVSGISSLGSVIVSGTVSATTLVGSLMSAGSIGVAGATVGTLYASTITSANAQVSGTVSATTLVGSLMSAGSIGVAGATVGTLYASTISSANAQVSGTVSAATFAGSLVTASSIGAAGATVGTLYAATISSANAQVSGTISAATLAGSLVTASSIGVAGATIGTLYASTITSANAQVSGTVSMGILRTSNLWVNGAVLNANDGTTSNWVMPGNNYIWSSDTSYNFKVWYNLQVPNVATIGSLYTTSITASNALLSGIISAATHVGTLMSAGSIGATGATIGTLYASTITASNAQISGVVSANSLSLNNGFFALSITNPVAGSETSMLFKNGSDSNTSWYVGHNVGSISSGNFGFYNQALGTAVTILGTSGNVGIGTKTPNYKLDVNGTINASSAISLQQQGSTILLQGGNLRPGGLETVYNGINFGSDIRMDCNNTFSSSPNYNLAQNGSTFILSCVNNPFQWNYRAGGQTNGTVIMNLNASGVLSVSSGVSSSNLSAISATVGSLYASTISSANAQLSGTVSAATYVGSLMSAGSFGASGITVGTLYASTISSANVQLSGTVSAATYVGTLMSAGSIGATGVTVGTLYTSSISSANAQVSGTVSAATLVGSLVSAASIGASGITVGTLYTSNISSANLQLSGTVSAATLVGTLMSAGSIGATGVTVGTLYASTVTAANVQLSGTVSAATLVGSLVSAASIGATGVTVGTLYASTISSANVQASGTVSAATHVGTLMSAGSIGASGATVGTLYATAITSANISISSTVCAGTLNISGNTTLGSIYASATNNTNWSPTHTFINNGNASPTILGLFAPNTPTSGSGIYSNILFGQGTGIGNCIQQNFVYSGNNNTSNNYSVTWMGGAGSSLFMNNAGRIGINTSNQAYTLDVNGGINASGGFTGASLQVSGTVSGSTLVGSLVSAGSIGASSATFGSIVITGGNASIYTTSYKPTLNPDAFNSMIVYEDQSQTTLFSSFITSGNGSISYNQNTSGSLGNSGYIQLTTTAGGLSNMMYLNVHPGNSFSSTFDFYAGNGNGADEIHFFWYMPTVPSPGSYNSGLSNCYNVWFSEWQGNIVLSWNGTALQTVSYSNLGNATWRTATITCIQNVIRVIVNGVVIINYYDTTNRNINSTNTYMGFGASSGASYNHHRIRNIKISKLSESLLQFTDITSGNMMLNGGNLGIGKSPSYTLDVNGTINATAFTGASLQVSGTITSGAIVLTNTYGVDLGYSGANQQIGLANRGASGFWGFGANNLAIQYQVPSGSSHIFYTGSTTGTSSAALGSAIATINSSGISSSSLQLSGSATVRANGASLNITNVTDLGETSIQFYSNSTSGSWYMGQNVGGIGTGNFSLYRAGTGNYITATTSGNVGIRTNTPAYNLDVNGSVNATSYTGGSMQISGAISASSLCVPSSTTISGSLSGLASQTNANITNLSFSNSTIASFVAYITVRTSAAAETLQVIGTYSIATSSWTADIVSHGDTSGVTLNITSAGQIRYTSGVNVPTFRWYARQLLI